MSDWVYQNPSILDRDVDEETNEITLDILHKQETKPFDRERHLNDLTHKLFASGDELIKQESEISAQTRDLNKESYQLGSAENELSKSEPEIFDHELDVEEEEQDTDLSEDELVNDDSEIFDGEVDVYGETHDDITAMSEDDLVSQYEVDVTQVIPSVSSNAPVNSESETSHSDVDVHEERPIIVRASDEELDDMIKDIVIEEIDFKID